MTFGISIQDVFSSQNMNFVLYIFCGFCWPRSEGKVRRKKGGGIGGGEGAECGWVAKVSRETVQIRTGENLENHP